MQPAVRTIYPKMVNSRQLTPLFSLDASAQEIIWIAGPVVTTFVAIQISTVVAHRRRRLLPRRRRRLVHLLPRGRPGAHPAQQARVRQSCSSARRCCSRRSSGFLLVGACAADRGRRRRDLRRRAAPRPASCSPSGRSARSSAASRSVTCRSGRGRSRGACSSCSSAWRSRSFALDFWWLAFALIIAGIGIAPALAVMFSIVSASVKFSDTAEAYGWVGTGQLIGAALGSAARGIPDRRLRARRRLLGRSVPRGARLHLRGHLPRLGSRPARTRREPHPRHRPRAHTAELGRHTGQTRIPYDVSIV